MRVRIGLHTGEASVSADGYVGFAVHQAARIGDLGHGGQILVSRTTAALVEHELPPELELRSLGEARLPGLDRSEELFQLVSEGLVNREIGDRLFLSEETVKSHVRHILAKLQARSRAHAVAVGFRRGLLT